MTDQWKQKRLHKRVKLSLPVYVRGHESADHEWMEMSHLIDVSPFGARFKLSYPTEPGRLLHLTLPMPRSLRCFDHAEDQYRVWSLVRHVRLLPQSERQKALIELGVAFAGKRPPASLQNDPLQRFEVAERPSESGLWIPTSRVDEVSGPYERNRRKETRHPIPIEVTAVAFAPKGQKAPSESAVTENISRHGAAVFSAMGLDPGRFTFLANEQHQVSVLAPVRDSRVGPDGLPRLHLEFIGSEWPLEDFS